MTISSVFKHIPNVACKFFAAGLLLLLPALSSCSEPEPTVVRFVIPDTFRGVFKVTPRPAAARARVILPKSVNEIVVPPIGIVHMSDTGGFMLVDELECVRKNGEEIPTTDPAGVPLGINLFPIYSDTGGDQFFLVGTRRERDKVWKEGRSRLELATPINPSDSTGE